MDHQNLPAQLGLTQDDSIVTFFGHIFQGISPLTAWANEVTTIPVNFRLDGLKHDFEPAMYALPHGIPLKTKHSIALPSAAD